MARIQCKKCGDVIESKHRHDFVWCSCKSIFIDGGNDYVRWGGDPKDIIIIKDDTDIYLIPPSKKKRKLNFKGIRNLINSDI